MALFKRKKSYREDNGEGVQDGDETSIGVRGRDMVIEEGTGK